MSAGAVQLRRKDWRTRLHQWARAMRGQPREWGRTDCGALARGALMTMFGRDVLAHVPSWTTSREAARVHRQVGSIAKVLDALATEKHTDLNFLHAGDLIVSTEMGESLGQESVAVCVDSRQCLISTPDGVEWDLPSPGTVYRVWQVPAATQEGQHGTR